MENKELFKNYIKFLKILFLNQMNKLVYILLLLILIFYAHCQGEPVEKNENDNITGGEGNTPTSTETPNPAQTPAQTPAEAPAGTTNANCNGHSLTGAETCDKLKVTDSTKKKCVLQSGSQTLCEEVNKESGVEMLNIFKISFALLILFTIL